MKKLQGILDRVLEDAFSVAMAMLKEEATGIVASTLKRALETRLKALLEEDGALALTLDALTRAKAKAEATSLEATPLEATQEVKEEAKPRKRKAKAQATPQEDNLTTILDTARVALARYKGVTTPRGKPLEEVLFRRLKKTLEYAQSLGKGDLRLQAQRALAIIDVDPMAAAMGSWKALASRLGLPVPIAE